MFRCLFFMGSFFICWGQIFGVVLWWRDGWGHWRQRFIDLFPTIQTSQKVLGKRNRSINLCIQRFNPFSIRILLFLSTPICTSCMIYLCSELSHSVIDFIFFEVEMGRWGGIWLDLNCPAQTPELTAALLGCGTTGTWGNFSWFFFSPSCSASHAKIMNDGR